jgi:hypothetical protein
MRMRYAVLALTAIMGMSGAFAQCLITDFEGYTLGANGVVLFRQPSFSGSTSGFLASTGVCDIPNGVYNCALISNEQAFSGTQSLKVAWQFRLNRCYGSTLPQRLAPPNDLQYSECTQPRDYLRPPRARAPLCAQRHARLLPDAGRARDGNHRGVRRSTAV